MVIKVLLLVLTEVSKATARYVETGTSYTLSNILGYLTATSKFSSLQVKWLFTSTYYTIINETLERQKWQGAQKEEKCIGTVIPKVSICDFVSNRRNVTKLEDLIT